METITKKVTFGLKLDDKLKAQAKAKKGFVRFINDMYFEVAYPVPTDKDFVYFKRENGQKVVA